MRIGRQEAPHTAICTSDAESITVRGRDLCGDIIGRLDFTSYFWLLVTGRQPDETQLFFANAVLAAIAEHGLVPSVVAARMTLAAAPEAMQGAVAAGLLGCGSVVLGSAEACGRFLADCLAAQDEGGTTVEEAAECAVRDAVPGVYGRSLPVNVNGAIPAVMLDVGFPLGALKGIALLARTAGLIGHLQEETERPIGFILSGQAASAIDYVGPPPPPRTGEPR